MRHCSLVHSLLSSQSAVELQPQVSLLILGCTHWPLTQMSWVHGNASVHSASVLQQVPLVTCSHCPIKHLSSVQGLLSSQSRAVTQPCPAVLPVSGVALSVVPPPVSSTVPAPMSVPPPASLQLAALAVQPLDGAQSHLVLVALEQTPPMQGRPPQSRAVWQDVDFAWQKPLTQVSLAGQSVGSPQDTLAAAAGVALPHPCTPAQLRTSIANSDKRLKEQC